VYEQNGASLVWKEQDWYGSSRLGMAKPEREVTGFFWASAAYTLVAGAKSYELSNHLGNVMAVISDRGELQSATDYFPFGMAMPGRSTDAKHRYGFNGKETDPETGLNDFGARLYDTRLGRWLAVDALANKFPDWSPYVAMNNNPLIFIDPTGKSAEPPVNLFRKKDEKVLHEVVKAFKYEVGDGQFSVFAHANHEGMQYETKAGKTAWLNTAEEFNALMTSRSEEWANAMKSGRKITVTLYACNTASRTYTDDHTCRSAGVQSPTEQTIAEKISATYPNVTVIAADGYVWSGYNSEGKPVILGVQSLDREGGFITIIKGKMIAKKKMTYNEVMGRTKEGVKKPLKDSKKSLEKAKKNLKTTQKSVKKDS
jgi:RHS repeat-associated protein